MVPVSRVRPLVEFLVRLYGVQGTSELSGVSPRVLGRVLKGDSGSVQRDTAEKLVELVQRHKRPSQQFMTYENEGCPRLATSKDAQDAAAVARAHARWQSISVPQGGR